jgi:Glutamate 5-kinase
VIEAGAQRALAEARRSLLLVGVIDVRGAFARGEIVAIESVDGERIATGLVNYGVEQARLIAGQSTGALRTSGLLVEGDALVHGDNMALV